MTYRHISENQSEVMQEFAKIAKGKKLIPEESGLERAARLLRAQDSMPKKTGLVPSDNLNQDILKLCSGLRENGMVAEAERVEDRFRHVTAQNYVRMYGTDGETGEALMDFAHPDGSVEMAEAKDKLGVVETKKDQQKVFREVAERDPIGKLASSETILSKANVLAVLKTILAQVPSLPTIPIPAAPAAAPFLGAPVTTFIANTGGALGGGAGAGMTGAAWSGVAIGALLGSWAGFEIFEARWKEQDLTKAAKRLADECNDVTWTPIEKENVTDLNTQINVVGSTYNTIDPKQATGKMVMDLKNNISKMADIASAIFKMAQDHEKKEWMSSLRDSGDVRAAAANLIEVCNKESVIMDQLIKRAKETFDTTHAAPTGEVKTQTASPTIQFADWLQQNLLNKEKEQAIRAKGPKLSAWLDQYKLLEEKLRSGAIKSIDVERNKKIVLDTLKQQGL